jgi:hypothetical protein
MPECRSFRDTAPGVLAEPPPWKSTRTSSRDDLVYLFGPGQLDRVLETLSSRIAHLRAESLA